MIKFVILFLVIYGLYLYLQRPNILTSKTCPASLSLKEARDILEVDQYASKEEINAAYYSQMKKHHPDIGGSKERAMQINAARQLLLKYVFIQP